jgi:hypothetical protein
MGPIPLRRRTVGTARCAPRLRTSSRQTTTVHDPQSETCQTNPLPSAGAQLTPTGAQSRQTAHTANRPGDLGESGSAPCHNPPRSTGRHAIHANPRTSARVAPHPDRHGIMANRSYRELTVGSWRVRVRCSPQPSTIYSRTCQVAEFRPSAGPSSPRPAPNLGKPFIPRADREILASPGPSRLSPFADPLPCRTSRCTLRPSCVSAVVPKIVGRRVDQARRKVRIEDRPDLRSAGPKMANVELVSATSRNTRCTGRRRTTWANAGCPTR